MKVMKSLLLGSAAGLVAMSGAQAADLPVKAKAVEYVKVCSAYGAGFYYIPGTDICLRVGGYLRADTYIHGPAGNGQTWFSTDAAVPINDADNAFGFRSRGALILDARTNTAYGTLRSYLVIHNSLNTAGTAAPGVNGSAGLDAAFIQFAGFTFGYAPSLWKFAGAYGFNAIVGSGDLVGIGQMAYTAQLGNGVTASISVEDAGIRRGKIANSGNMTNTVGGGAAAYAGTVSSGYAGQYYPDVVANIRVDQAWGSAIIMGALHHVESAVGSFDPQGQEKWGYAVGGGIEVKLDSIAPKDRAQILFTYTKGATGYLAAGPVNNAGTWAVVSNSLVGPEAIWADAEVSATGVMSLAKAYGGVAQFQHYWTPMLRTNIGAGYVKYNAANIAFANTVPDFKMWQGTIATIWSPVANLDLGVEVMYVDIETKNGALNAGVSNRGAASGDGWAGTFRAQRNF